ncbi:MAG: cell division protein [Romboutsia sp.]
MNGLEISNNAKLIAIGEDGIRTLSTIENIVKDNMEFEKITINQDVDKDYVRNLLDGVDVLFLTYSTEDRRAKDIVKAIGYMAKERRVLGIGLNSSTKEDSDDLNIDREFKIGKENKEKITSIINIMLESISDFCMINIDITDLKEVIGSGKGLKYSYEEFDSENTASEVAKVLVDNMSCEGSEFEEKKGILFIDMDKNHCEENNMLIAVNTVITELHEKLDNSLELIFSLYIKENESSKARIGLIHN